MRTDWIPTNDSQWLNRSLARIESYFLLWIFYLAGFWLVEIGGFPVPSKSGFLPYCFWSMLLDAFLKPLSSATSVPTITVAHIFINNQPYFVGWQVAHSFWQQVACIGLRKSSVVTLLCSNFGQHF